MLRRLILLSRMTLPMRNSSEFFQALFSQKLLHIESSWVNITNRALTVMVLFVVRHFGSTALGSTSESTVELNYWG